MLAFVFFSRKKGVKTALLFMVPAAMWGWLIEFFSIFIFHRYYYAATYTIYALGVPLYVPLAWATVIFVGYYIITSKFHIKNLVKIETMTATTATLFDIIMLEPLAFAYKFWLWTPESIWFGAPLVNFIGWIFAISLFVFAYKFATEKVKGWKQQVVVLGGLVGVNLIVLETIVYIWLEALKITI
ncbi:MAG: carotenoid biosynthesis protein [archaeon]